MVILHFPRERFAFDCVPAFSYSSFSWRIIGKGCHCPVNSFFLFFLFKNAQIKLPWQWCVCVFVLCLCAQLCVFERRQDCLTVWPLLTEISSVRQDQHVSRYNETFIKHEILASQSSSVTTAREFYDYYNNHKNDLLLGKWFLCGLILLSSLRSLGL